MTDPTLVSGHDLSTDLSRSQLLQFRNWDGGRRRMRILAYSNTTVYTCTHPSSLILQSIQESSPRPPPCGRAHASQRRARQPASEIPMSHVHVERTKAGAARLTRAARVRVAIRGLKRCCWSGSLLEEVTHTRAHINDEKNSGASWRSACTEDEEDREVATMRD